MKTLQTFVIITIALMSNPIQAQTTMLGVLTFPGAMKLGPVPIESSQDAITKGVGNLYLTSSYGGYQYDDSVRLIRNDGVITHRKKLPNYTSGTQGTNSYWYSYTNSLSFNHSPFVAGRSFQDDFGLFSMAVWKWDTLTNTLNHIRGFKAPISHIYDTPDRIYVTVNLHQYTHIGTGLLGNNGVSLVNLNPMGGIFQTALIVLDHSGNIIQNPAHFYEAQKNTWAKGIFETSNGNIGVHLVRSVEGQLFEDTYEEYCVLLDPSTIANASMQPNVITQTAYYSGEISLAEDTITQNFYLAYIPRDNIQTEDERIEKYVGENWTSVDYIIPYFGSPTNTPHILAHNHLAVNSNYGSLLQSYIIGTDAMDTRYDKNSTISNGLGKITSFTGLQSEGYLVYSNGLDSIWGNPVPVNTIGTGLAFFNLDNTPISDRMTTNTSDPDVIESFDYVMRSDTNSMLMDTSENHIAYMQFLHDTTYLNIGIGNIIPESWVDAPSGWQKAPNMRLAYDPYISEYYFYAGANKLPYYDQAIVLKVICTTDDIYDYTIYNNPPVFNDTITTHYYAELNQFSQFDLSATDNDGDILYYWMSGLIPIGMTMDNSTGIISGTPTLVGNYVNKTVLCYDGIDTTTRLVNFHIVSSAGLSSGELGDIRVYPNPSESIIHIESPEVVSKVVISDSKGRTLITTTTNDIDISGLACGLYSVQVTTEHGIYSTRFVRE